MDIIGIKLCSICGARFEYSDDAKVTCNECLARQLVNDPVHGIVPESVLSGS